jgi:hypothetical protein
LLTLAAEHTNPEIENQKHAECPGGDQKVLDFRSF